MTRIAKRLSGRLLLASVAVVALVGARGVAWAQEAQDSSNAALMNRIEKLETELSNLKALLQKNQARADAASQKAEEAADTATMVASKVEAMPSDGGSFSGGGIFNYTAGDYHFHLGGYAGSNLEVVDNGENSTFADVNFNPIFLIGYKDWLQFESELEFETRGDEETKVELEYAHADLFLNDYMTLVIGKTLSPVGIFQERLHPKWINKSIDRPIGFDGIVEPKTEVGVQLRGGVPLGESAKVTYTFMIGNGPQIEDNGIPILEGFGEDNNDNKALSGRFSVFPMPWLEVGASGMIAKVNGVEGMGGPAPGNADFMIWGTHAIVTYKDIDLRFEYLNSVRDPILSAAEPSEAVALLPKEDLEAWYVQGAYKLAGLTDEPLLRAVELVGRFSELNVNGSAHFADDAQQRWSFNVNYLFAANVIAKAGYELRDFDNPLLGNENRFLAQFAYGF
ncbi:MAG: hypothetical protein D6782_01280 [Alphaproteobacteria bacterium]|nr:MAG: hypothetical protein D6782_01280 [Alphaproteobacteria bacterium]